jgi:ribonuclease HII
MPGYVFDARFFPSDLVSPFFIAGVDEAGRGPLAGPVVAAAVILPREPKIHGLRDSKIVPLEQREALFCEIQEHALAYAVCEISPAEIDAINILQASLKAMRQALSELSQQPSLVLVDGNQKPRSGFNEMTIIDGDALSASIMAASILAKVTRDHIMWEEHEKYPQYGFDEHKGYGAPVHMEALAKYGPCPIHRRSFAPVRNCPLRTEETCPNTTETLAEAAKN